MQKKGPDATPFADYIEIKGLLDLPRGSRKAAASALRSTMSDFDWKRGPGHNLFPKGEGPVMRTSSLAAGSPSSRPHGPLWDADPNRGPDAVDHRPAEASTRFKGREDKPAEWKDKGGLWDSQRTEGAGQERPPFRPGTAPGPMMGWKSDSPLSDRLRTASTSSTYEVRPSCLPAAESLPCFLCVFTIICSNYAVCCAVCVGIRQRCGYLSTLCYP